MPLFRLLIISLSSCLFLGAAEPTARLPRSTPESQGVSSAALLGFIESAEEKLNALHSFMLVRHGQVIAEGWWAPYAPEARHQMFSLSKSFTSTAVGLAVADGKMNVDDLVLKYFPEDAPPQPSANLRAMRVKDLLTMSTGHHAEDIAGFPYASEESLVKKFLALPVPHKPGTFFLYNTPASYMLSAIVQKVTGQTVLEYLRPRLFEPLGIAEPTWDASKQGVSFGGFGLSVRTEDIAKFGQLYLQKGDWRGKQLLPGAWVETATSRHVSNGSSPTSDWEQGYGFQFWRCRYGFYRGDGAHGQYCVVLPQYDAVIAITSGLRNMGAVLDLIWEKIVPALEASALAANSPAHQKLASKLSTLALRVPSAVSSEKTSGLAKSIAGKRYLFPQNPLKLESMTVEPASFASEPNAIVLTVRNAGTDQPLTAGSRTWIKTSFGVGVEAQPVALSGAWTGDDTYTLSMVGYLTPFQTNYHMKFVQDEVTIQAEPNLGPTSPKPPALTGKAE